MASIFVSYRREDTINSAGRLTDILVSEFGESKIFIDVDKIKPGHFFEEKIFSVIENCQFFLAIIGPKWLYIKNDRGQLRLNDKNDFVRREISVGLSSSVSVIPVLVGGAKMPRVNELPSAIKNLARLNAFSIDSTRFGYDANYLVDFLKNEIQPKPEIETKKVKIPLTLIRREINHKAIKKRVEEEAHNGWRLVGNLFDNGLFGFSRGVNLMFQRNRR